MRRALSRARAAALAAASALALPAAAGDDPLDPQRLAMDPAVDAAELSPEDRAALCADLSRPVSTYVLDQIAGAGLAAFSEAARMSAGLDRAEDDGAACRATFTASGFVAGSYTEGVTATCTVAAFLAHNELGWTVDAIDPATCTEALP